MMFLLIWLIININIKKKKILNLPYAYECMIKILHIKGMHMDRDSKGKPWNECNTLQKHQQQIPLSLTLTPMILWNSDLKTIEDLLVY